MPFIASGGSAFPSKLFPSITSKDPSSNSTANLVVPAETALKNIGGQAVNVLVAAELKSNLMDRRKAARILGEIKSDIAVEPLIEALKDEDDHVRAQAAEALAEIKSESS